MTGLLNFLNKSFFNQFLLAMKIPSPFLEMSSTAVQGKDFYEKKSLILAFSQWKKELPNFITF
ncbi:MAG: hypothetical protein ACN6NU_12100 [Acinetobacter sp.]